MIILGPLQCWCGKDWDLHCSLQTVERLQGKFKNTNRKYKKNTNTQIETVERLPGKYKYKSTSIQIWTVTRQSGKDQYLIIIILVFFIRIQMSRPWPFYQQWSNSDSRGTWYSLLGERQDLIFPLFQDIDGTAAQTVLLRGEMSQVTQHIAAYRTILVCVLLLNLCWYCSIACIWNWAEI